MTAMVAWMLMISLVFDLNNDNRVSRYEMIRQLETYFLDDVPGDDNNEVLADWMVRL